MKKFILSALLFPAIVFAQTFPSPTFNVLTLQTPLAVAHGGTNATTAAAARTSLGAAASGANTDITSLSSPALGAATATTATTGTNNTQVATTTFANTAATNAAALVGAPRDYIAGLTLSTAGSSTTMSIAAGAATDSGNAISMSLASAISKTTGSWAVGNGNGGLDTGTVAASTWYYFYEIERTDTGVADVVFSLSNSAPTLPTNYTKYRYIGGALTNGSSQWTQFVQVGDDFYWTTIPEDVNTTLTTTATSFAISVPRGRKVKAYLQVYFAGTNNAGGVRVYDPDIADSVLSLSGNYLDSAFATQTTTGATRLTIQNQCYTNTSAQIRAVSDQSQTFEVGTLGWNDSRGKNL
jgi:hypothetical protein